MLILSFTFVPHMQIATKLFHLSLFFLQTCLSCCCQAHFFIPFHLTPTALQFPFQVPSHPYLQNEIQSEKPDIQNSLQHDFKPTFTVCISYR